MGIDKKCLESELGHSVLLWFQSFDFGFYIFEKNKK